VIAMFVALAACVGARLRCEHLQLPAPATIVIATSRGEYIVPISEERGHPALSAPALSRVLPLTAELKSDWASVTFAGQAFRFLLNAPVFIHGDRVVPLVAGAYLARDTLFLPLQWLTGYLPTVFTEGYRYDALAGRFEEAAVSPVIARTPVRPPPPAPPASARRGRFPPSGVLRKPHSVVVDAGHGGVDPGNPGLHFPGNLREKDVNLSIAKLLRKELERRGIEVVMTRSKDTLIALGDRGRFCHDECDLFLSIHVNSLPRHRGYEDISGIETYFLAAARTEDADRVARMENDALRYDTGPQPDNGDPLQFILKDLQTNEYLRESAVLADLIQARAGKIHPGGSRGVSQAGFVVLTTARRPAVLVESGFSTNRVDSRFLTSSEGQVKLAQALADAVVEYLRQLENKVAFEAEP
jgi:N-acetylmuramoyl-L-alanine amidase